MSWVIDQIKVKPSGFLASWRYRNVLIDENGVVTNERVPGEEYMNLPCQSDYKKSVRRYSEGQLITEFCNLTTFTNYRVYAQNCEPFVYVQTDINATKCGYVVPLPTPGLPPSPFGPLTYGLYKFFEFCDIGNQEGIQSTITVNFYKKNYTGEVVEITTGSESPVQIQYKDIGEKMFGIQSSECIIGLNVDENFKLAEFYTSDEREYLCEILTSGTLTYKGYVIPDSCNEPFIAPPYDVEIRLTDGLGSLQMITYPVPTGNQTLKDVLCYCFAMTNLELDVCTVCNIYATNMVNGLNDDPLAQAVINPLRFSDQKGHILTCYDVLEAICENFFGFIKQSGGKWHFRRLNELSNQVIRMRVYSYTGFFLRGENVQPLRVIGQNQELTFCDGYPEMSIGNAYKRITSTLYYGDVPAYVFNGDFELWDGSNFTYWSKYGGIDVSRIQNTVKGSGGASVLVDDYSLQFNESANSGKWIQAMPINTRAGSKFRLTISLSKPKGDAYFVFRIKVGSYYLTNDIFNTNFQWVQSQSAATYKLPFQPLNSLYYVFSIDTPPTPEDGDIFIQLFGVQYYYLEPIGLDVDNFILAPYQLTSIDDVEISVSNETNNSYSTGIDYISEQLGFFTPKKDDANSLSLLFGDLGSSLIFAPNGAETQNLTIDLYAIQVKGSYTEFWQDYGQTATALPLGLAIARAAMTMYQAPFRYLDCSIRALPTQNVSPLDILQIVVPFDPGFSSKKFTILSGTYDLKYKQVKNARLREIFAKNAVTNDVPGVPHYSGTVDGPITQDANNINPSGVGGIFTQEFTQEFT